MIDSNGAATNALSQNVSQPALAHPLYRPRSQEDLNTIERNARKKLFTKDDNSYPTLKMDQQQHGVGINSGGGNSSSSSGNVQQSAKPRSPATRLPQAHEENEKKNSLKKIQNYFIDMVEEKFQTKASASSSNDGATSGESGKKGMKFGIRVLPPSLIGGSKSTADSGKSPNKVQADNDNNANIEKIECTSAGVDKAQQQPQQHQQQPIAVHPAPPEAMKRNKNKASKVHQAAAAATAAVSPTTIPTMAAVEEAKPTPFERQASINSSGIKRDAAGIPQVS